LLHWCHYFPRTFVYKVLVVYIEHLHSFAGVIPLVLLLARILLGSDSTSQMLLADHRAQLGVLAASHRDLREAFNDLGATHGVLAKNHSDLSQALLGQH
jgi:hypothetical protein